MRHLQILLICCLATMTAWTQRADYITDNPEVPAAIPACGHMPDMYRDNCNRSKLRDHFKRHLRYPEDARARGTQGDVEVIVQIDTLGQVTATRLVKKGDPGLDAEALRLVRMLSDGGKTWSPAINGGRKVTSEYLIRVPFLLEEPSLRQAAPLAPAPGPEK